MKGKEKKREIDKERENILPLCQYNIYANHAFSVCVNFIKHKKTNTVAAGKKKTQSPENPTSVKVILRPSGAQIH